MTQQYTGKLDIAKITQILQSDNLADDLDEMKISQIQSSCQELYNKDAESCSAWREEAKLLMQIAALKDKSRMDFIDGWQADIQLPDLIFSAIQFNARTLPEYIKDGKVCQAKQIGKFSQDKQSRLTRVCKFINWQLTSQIDEWTENFDKLLLQLPIVGHLFKITIYDNVLNRPTDTLLMPDCVTVNNEPNNPDWMRRISIDMTVNQNTYKDKIVSGAWRDITLIEKDGTEYDQKYDIVQMHCWYDLDDDGYQEPYIITLEKSEWKLLSIIPRFDGDSLIFKFDPKDPDNTAELVGIDAVDYITSYQYCPAPDGSALGIGLGHIIKTLGKTRNTTINQILDNGTQVNLNSGFIKQGLFRDDGNVKMRPNEWKIVDAAFSGSDIKDAIFPLPVNEASQSTFLVFKEMGDIISKIAQTGEIMSGEGAPANMPATSVLAIIEQGKISQRVILKRINYALTRELKCIYRLNLAHLSNSVYQNVLDESANVAQDFNLADCDIEPVADPMFSTRVERLMRTQAAMQIGIQSPLLVRDYLIELGYDQQEAEQLAQGDAQAKAAIAQGQQQMEMMQKQQDLLKQQTESDRQKESLLKAELEVMKAKMELVALESKVKLDEANAAKTMAETMQLQDELQFQRNQALLNSAMPAIPTDEELEDEVYDDTTIPKGTATGMDGDARNTGIIRPTEDESQPMQSAPSNQPADRQPIVDGGGSEAQINDASVISNQPNSDF